MNNLGKLVVVCDIKFDRANEFAKKYNAVSYKKMNNKINVDIVSVCSPNNLKVEHIIKFINNEFHVLCEKLKETSILM